MGFFNGIPRKLIQRVTEIEIDTHYYDKDVVPSNQDLFIYSISRFGDKDKAKIKGFSRDGIDVAIIPYRIKIGDETSNMYATVNTLEIAAFKNYTDIETITIPNTIHEISESCFEGCSNLSQCNIPKSIQIISSKAFKNCSKLDTLFIGTNVKEIANNAFDGCAELDIICYKGSYAETYAKEHNIPYSLISYVLDKDITKDSPNFVTSGTIYNRLAYISNVDISTIYKSGIYNLELVGNDKCYLNDSINKTFKLYYENNKYIDVTLPSNNYYTATLIVSCKEVYSNNIPNYISNQSLILTKSVNSKIYSEVWNNQLLVTYDTNTYNYNYSYNNLWSNNQLCENLISKQSQINNLNVNSGNLNEVTADNNSLVTKQYVDTMVRSMEIGTKDGANYVSGTLIGETWNTISLNKLYNQSWKFISKPYVYTDDGLCVDFEIKDTEVNANTIVNGFNTFKMYVPVNCNYSIGTIDGGVQPVILDGYQMDYLVLKYYYTGIDGKDLDTVTEIENINWTLSKEVGYGKSNSIINNGITLIQWGGDNTGGGTGNINDKYYESIYFNINAIQDVLDEDIEIILYGTWYNTKINGKITVMLDCYTCDNIPTISTSSNKIITLSGNNLIKTYFNDNLFQCTIDATSKSNSTYKTSYTPACKLTLHKSAPDTNYRTISIEALN